MSLPDVLTWEERAALLLRFFDTMRGLNLELHGLTEEEFLRALSELEDLALGEGYLS